jgi:hypothetical protein
MFDEIGVAAGELWTYLRDNGETSAIRLRSQLKMPQSLFFLALGWLARENKVVLAQRDRMFWIAHRP